MQPMFFSMRGFQRIERIFLCISYRGSRTALGRHYVANSNRSDTHGLSIRPPAGDLSSQPAMSPTILSAGRGGMS